MKIKLYIWIVENSHGDKSWDVTSESANDIFIQLENDQYETLHFENRAYRLEDWALNNNLKYKLIEKEIEI